MEKDTKLLNMLISWAQRDFLIIVICLVSLLVCFWTIHGVSEYQVKINQAWQKQWLESGCTKIYTEVPNISFNAWGLYNETKD